MTTESTDIVLEDAWYWTETAEDGDGEGAQERVYRHRAEREVTAQVWRKADGEIGYTVTVDGKPRYTAGGWEIDAAWNGATPEAQMAGILTDIRSAWGRWQ